MRFCEPLIPGTLIRRYKRFLADVCLADGTVVTAHCPNSGSMKLCADPGWAVLLSRSPNPARRLPYTWEMVHNGRCWIGVNTGWPPKIAAEAILRERGPELSGDPSLRSEVPYGHRRSRIDLLLEDGARRCYVEVKNVTLIGDDGTYCFPDAVTERGLKHLLELMDMVKEGHRAVMLYVIQRADGAGFRPAWEIDPEYARTLVRAERRGVEILPYLAQVRPGGIRLGRRIEYTLTAGRE